MSRRRDPACRPFPRNGIINRTTRPPIIRWRPPTPQGKLYFRIIIAHILLLLLLLLLIMALPFDVRMGVVFVVVQLSRAVRPVSLRTSLWTSLNIVLSTGIRNWTWRRRTIRSPWPRWKTIAWTTTTTTTTRMSARLWRPTARWCPRYPTNMDFSAVPSIWSNRKWPPIDVMTFFSYFAFVTLVARLLLVELDLSLNVTNDQSLSKNHPAFRNLLNVFFFFCSSSLIQLWQVQG